MLDFKENLVRGDGCRPLICAHRGVSAGNIPCNTIAAFSAALAQGADMIELDVTESRDGRFFVFHPGKESAHLRSHKLISAMKGDRVKKLRYVNQDNDETQFGVDELCDILDFLKGKCYINVDKFWTDIPGISREIRRVGVEKQVVVKTALKDKYLQPLKECAADFMFLPIVRNEDKVTDMLRAQGINCVGAEILFEQENAPVVSREYVSSMHEKGMALFVNAIVYNYKEVLSAGHNDDISAAGEPERGWGWLIDRGFDIIQTDWCGMLRGFMDQREGRRSS